MISKKQVKHIAKLARIGLRKEKIKKIQRDLDSILDYFNKLKEVDLDKISLEKREKNFIGEVTREDVKKEESPQVVKKIMKEAPAKKAGFIKVKTVL